MYRQFGNSPEVDFERDAIVNEGSTIIDQTGKYSQGFRDRPRFMQQMSGTRHPLFKGMSGIRHPLAMSGFFDNLYNQAASAITSAVDSALPKAQTAAVEALNKVAGGVASDVLSKPSVQTALTEQVKSQATNALAVKLQAMPAQFMSFWAKNKMYIALGGAGLLGLILLPKIKKMIK